jgi:hypothetical protein
MVAAAARTGREIAISLMLRFDQRNLWNN